MLERVDGAGRAPQITNHRSLCRICAARSRSHWKKPNTLSARAARNQRLETNASDPLRAATSSRTRAVDADVITRRRSQGWAARFDTSPSSLAGCAAQSSERPTEARSRNLVSGSGPIGFPGGGLDPALAHRPNLICPCRTQRLNLTSLILVVFLGSGTRCDRRCQEAHDTSILGRICSDDEQPGVDLARNFAGPGFRASRQRAERVGLINIRPRDASHERYRCELASTTRKGGSTGDPASGGCSALSPPPATRDLSRGPHHGEIARLESRRPVDWSGIQGLGWRDGEYQCGCVSSMTCLISLSYSGPKRTERATASRVRRARPYYLRRIRRNLTSLEAKPCMSTVPFSPSGPWHK